MLLETNVRVKDPFKIQDQTMDFNLAEHKKCTDVASDSVLQLTSKNLPLIVV